DGNGRPQSIEIVIGQSLTDDVGERAQDRPVFLGIARWKRCAAGPLDTALEIDVEAVFLRVGGPGQDHIGMMRSCIAMAALIDDEGAAEMADIEFVGAEQVDEIDLALLRAIDDRGKITAALLRDKTKIKSPHARSRRMQDVESVPTAFCGTACGSDHACIGSDPRRQLQNRRAVASCDRSCAKYDHRPLGTA